MAAMMKNTGVIVANDISGERMKPLGINLQKAGVTNTIITMSKGHRFSKVKINFDKILVDAPCSGTGTIRRSLKTLQIWNPYMIRRLAGTQRILLDSAFQILKSSGTLVYSTCSLEPEENEAVVDWLLQKYDNANIEKIKIQIKSSAPILEFNGSSYSSEIKKCLRIWPQDNDTEGFFVAKIKKS
jgi:NOL1/NOP2/sun family putative RNA methylase